MRGKHRSARRLATRLQTPASITQKHHPESGSNEALFSQRSIILANHNKNKT
jgi:hypothetical protein